MARIAFRLTFGLLTVIIGSALILWVCYNEFIHRLPQYTGTHWWEPFGVGPVMIAMGVYWLRTLRQSSDNRRNETQPQAPGAGPKKRTAEPGAQTAENSGRYTAQN